MILVHPQNGSKSKNRVTVMIYQHVLIEKLPIARMQKQLVTVPLTPHVSIGDLQEANTVNCDYGIAYK